MLEIRNVVRHNTDEPHEHVFLGGATTDQVPRDAGINVENQARDERAETDAVHHGGFVASDPNRRVSGDVCNCFSDATASPPLRTTRRIERVN